jgi:ubiquinone/menaquinone biosynthesis C-methylase UbiE
MSDSEVLRAEERRLRRAYSVASWDRHYTGTGKARIFFAQEQERALLALLRRRGHASLEKLAVLEIGCGTGRALKDLIRWGADPRRLAGVDLLRNRLDEARRTCPADVTLVEGNAAHLPFPDGGFDVVMQFTVFTSILDDAVRRRVAAEMRRVLRPGGVVIWYDFFARSPNPNVRPVRKSELRSLFPGYQLDIRRVTLAPPLARIMAERAWWVAEVLQKIPLLRTHYLVAISQRASS